MKNNWEKIKLGNSEYITLIMGQSPPSSTYNSEGKGIPFFQGKKEFGEKYPTVEQWCTEPQKMVLEGDILLSVRAPVGSTNIAPYKASIGRGLAGIRASSNQIDQEYLYWFLQSIEEKLSNSGAGSTFTAITKSDLEEIEIPLPPLSIQKKIANALDKADEIRRKRQEAIEKLDELVQSVFLDMFGDPAKNEKGWKTAPTIKFSESIVPGRDKPKSFTGNIPWVTTNDLNHLGYTYKSSNGTGLTESEITKVKAKIIPRDSVIITCVGDLGVATVNKEAMVVNQQLHAFQCDERLVPEFLMLNLSHQTEYMNKMASTTTVPYMNKTVANNIPTIVPPKELQEKFRDSFVEINNKKKLVSKVTLRDTDLFNSLMQKAFRGELEFN